jgi:putative ABC transport system permease protein
MPDWKKEIRKRLSRLRLQPTREAEIVEELAQHLDDRYEQSLENGATQEEAYQAALLELTGSDLLAQELRHVERPVRQEPVVMGTQRRMKVYVTGCGRW